MLISIKNLEKKKSLTSTGYSIPNNKCLAWLIKWRYLNWPLDLFIVKDQKLLAYNRLYQIVKNKEKHLGVY